jgi:peroxiredoxin
MIRTARLPWLLLISAALSLSGPANARTPAPGDVAPNFELTLVDGRKVTLADLKGQVVVLNFWATWCVPCRAELPTLDAYYKIQKGHGLRVFAVTTEDSVSEKKLHDLFAVMTIEPIHKIKGPYGYIGHAVPTNFVIDRDGKIRYAKAGAFNLETLNAVLLPLLNEPPPAKAQVASAN